MADTSRKRSRKSKLVLRECLMDEDLELQVPATKIPKNLKQRADKVIKTEPTTSFFKSVATCLETITSNPEKPAEVCDTSVLRKINASARNSVELDKTPPRKFEIDIQVECCEDEDDFDEVIEIKDISSPSEQTEDVDVKSDPILESEEDKQKTKHPRPITLTLETILEAVDKLQNSENKANKILSIHVRNTIGYEVKIKPNFHWIENRIQEALDLWRDWQTRSFHRGEPLFYKCYVCIQSYWYLADFRAHLLSIHAEDTKINISIERYELHECNVIAYHKEMMVIQDIFTPGLCYRCGGDYAAHEIALRFEEKYYKNDACSRYFFCCTGLVGHFSSCSICNVNSKQFQCDICMIRFDTDKKVRNHLVLSHLVRSDVPILTHYTNSKTLEEEQYNCAKNCFGKNLECVHSILGVPKNSLEPHMKRLIETYRCEICELVMVFSCMRYEHMLSHTEDFMVVKKCTACEGLNVFVNSDDALAHWNSQHKMSDLRQQLNNFHKIFVPWSCIYKSLAEPDLKRQEVAMIGQESITQVQESMLEVNESMATLLESMSEVQESMSEIQESMSEIQESEADEQESDVDEKPSLLDIEEGVVSGCQQSWLQEQSDTKDFKIEDTIVKEEPQDSDDSTGLVIKEEPLDFDETFGEHSETQNFDDQIQVKEEIDEEIDEYDDLIKLNFNLEDLLVKEESREISEETQESENVDEETQGSENVEAETQDSDNEFNSEDDSQDSELQPKVVKERKRRKRNRKIYKCTCGFQSPHKEYRKHLSQNCSKNLIKTRNVKCTKCDTTFHSMKKFLSHFEQHGYAHLCCPECQRQFENYTTLGQHVQTHVRQNFVRVQVITYTGEEMANKDYQCTKCAAKVDYPEFFDHWETHIKAEPSTPVSVVSKKKSREVKCGQLSEDVIKECVGRLQVTVKECNVCLRIFNRSNECKRHIIEHMLVDAYTQKHLYKELRCQICEAGFAFSDKYKKHMRDHAALPVYKCELCDRTFSDSSNFTKHKKVHNLRVIICDLCGKKFQSKLSLEKHIEKHRNTTPITCNICNKVFYFDSSYRRHVRSYHEKPTTEYRCVICGERFPCLKLKWDHMWEKHEERKQKADCPICFKSFRKFSDVRAHAKSEHLTAVTVINIKGRKTQTAEKKRSVVAPKPVNSNWPTLTVGSETETLIIYDSD